MQDAITIWSIMENRFTDSALCIGCGKSTLNMTLTDHRWFRSNKVWICTTCHAALQTARNKAQSRLPPSRAIYVWKLVERSTFLHLTCTSTDFNFDLSDTSCYRFFCDWCGAHTHSERRATCDINGRYTMHLHCAKRITRLLREGLTHAIMRRLVHHLPTIRDLQFHIAHYVALLVAHEAGQVASEVCLVKAILA